MIVLQIGELMFGLKVLQAPAREDEKNKYVYKTMLNESTSREGEPFKQWIETID